MDCILGKLSFTPSKLAEEIQSRVFELKPADTNTAWTIAVKSTLAALASEHKLKQEYTEPKSGCSEFMLDAVWWNDSKESDQKAVMGVECEWGNTYDFRKGANAAKAIASAVEEDFWKLLAFETACF